MSAKLGEILVRENLVTPQQLREALDYQRSSGGRLGSNLVKLGMISDDVITAVLSRQYGVPSINLDLFQIDDEVIKLISQEVALKYTILPISKVGATLTLAMADPTNVFAMDDIKFMTGLNVEPVIASEASIQMAIGKYYSGSTQIDIFDQAIVSYIDYARAGFNDQKRFDAIYGTDPSTDQLEAWDIAREICFRIAWKPYMYSQTLPHLLRSVKVPTLIAWGDKDRIVPLATAKRFTAALPNSKLEVIKDCGHCVDLEQPDQLAKLVSSFLAR